MSESVRPCLVKEITLNSFINKEEPKEALNKGDLGESFSKTYQWSNGLGFAVDGLSFFLACRD